MYYCDSDWILFLRILNTTMVFCAAVIIAWTRHGDPVPNPLAGNFLGVPIMKRVRFDDNYATSVYLDDTVSDHDGAIIKQMILAGEALTFRSAQARGLTRAGWNKARQDMINMKLAVMAEGGRLVVTSRAYAYFNIDPTKKEV